jgi:hypothetical protein
MARQNKVTRAARVGPRKKGKIFASWSVVVGHVGVDCSQACVVATFRRMTRFRTYQLSASRTHHACWQQSPKREAL